MALSATKRKYLRRTYVVVYTNYSPSRKAGAMKVLYSIIIAISLMVSIHGQELPHPKMAQVSDALRKDQREPYRLEDQIWAAFQAQDIDAVKELVRPRATLASAGGFQELGEIKPGPGKNVIVKYYIHPEGLQVQTFKRGLFGCQVFAVSYRIDIVFIANGHTYGEIAYCSSVWTKNGKHWQLASHHESRATIQRLDEDKPTIDDKAAF